MKRYYFIIFLLFTSNFLMQAQSFKLPRFYVGIEGFKDRLFDGNEGYYGIHIGSEVIRYKFIAPEIEVGFYSGSIDKNEDYDFERFQNGTIPETFPDIVGYTTGGFNAIVYSFTPKLIIGDEDLFFFILPIYSYARIKSYANYFALDKNEQSYNRVERGEQKTKQSAFSIGIGVEGFVFETDKMSLAFMVMYNLLNLEEAFEGIQVKGLKSNQINGAVGLGLRFYFNPFINK